MDESWYYEIRVEGVLSERWADWFEGLTIHSGPGDYTVMSGPLVDQAALLGVLNKIHAFNLTLVSVNRKVLGEQRPEKGAHHSPRTFY